MAKKAADCLLDPITLKVAPLGRLETMSGHAYRDRKGIEVYVWVRTPGRATCGIVRLSRKQIETYLRLLTRGPR